MTQYYILINPEEAYPELEENTEGQLTVFDTSQLLLPITSPNPIYDDYIKYSKEQIDLMQYNCYFEDDEGDLFNLEIKYPSRKTETIINLLKTLSPSE
jgi:hypothetical protein